MQRINKLRFAKIKFIYFKRLFGRSKKCMKKNKIVLSVTIGLTCFVLFLAIFMQFKVVKQTDIAGIETMTEAELRTELAEWKSKYAEITEQNDETYEKINQYQEESNTDSQTQELMESELSDLNKILGVTDVEGKGIEVTLVNEDTADADIEAIDLSLIVNALKGAGAEAISINDQRIIAMSDIVDITTVNAFYIKVNGQRISSPYVIKAIGDPAYLEASLIGSGGYADELKALGHTVTIVRKDNVEISKYSKEISNKYIK
jgi:uncharacterized protein YlxW (UPF0749 family)